MSNAVKLNHQAARLQPAPRRAGQARRARSQVAITVLLLLALTRALPDPDSWWIGMAGVASPGSTNAIDAVGGALLAAGSCVVWGLLAWCLLAGCVLAVARLPGAAGHAGRATLLRVAPLPALRVLGAAVGLSVVAATSACAAPSVAPGADASTVAVSEPGSGPLPTRKLPAQAVDTPNVPTATAPIDTAPVDIDWPATTAATDGTSIAPQSVAAAPVPTAGTAEELPADRAPAGPPGATADSGTPRTVPPAATAAGQRVVIVRPGDSLWAIAQRALPLSATDESIDAAWRSWYLTNTAVIGDNPDLISPGQVLLAPQESRLT